jgi:hypothetical protein
LHDLHETREHFSACNSRNDHSLPSPTRPRAEKGVIEKEKMPGIQEKRKNAKEKMPGIQCNICSTSLVPFQP